MIRLRDIAHVRSGDKGDTGQISVIAYRPEDHAIMTRWLTAERVSAWLPELPTDTRISRTDLPGLGALQFVLVGALRGGVTRSLALDAHGKTLAMQLLDIELPVDDAVANGDQQVTNERNDE